jgi:D-beta-D-heptose 7-phosphate kinase/D-beta-D-heptose 1-phosphate adenosyltransferase
VDWVVPFDDDTPAAIIAELLPDILVKGGDYTDVTAIVGYESVVENGGEVRILPFLEGHSTTRIIETIQGKPHE